MLLVLANFFCWVLLFKESWRQVIIKAFLLQSLQVVVVTELLSSLQLLNVTMITVTWFSITILLLGLIAYRGCFAFKKPNCYPFWKHYGFMIAIILVLLFMLGCYYSSAEGDSFTYHLPRIYQWLAYGNVDHYPTCDARQLFHQPFAEFFLLHLQALTGSDTFFFILQYASLIGCALLAGLIAQVWGLAYQSQMIAMMIVLTMPMGITQATGTQTDLCAAFFLMSFIYFFFRYLQHQDDQLIVCWWASLSLGLGLFTKLTVGIFAVPFCLWGLGNLFKHRTSIIYTSLFGGMILIVVLNGPFYYRNYRLTKNVFGDEQLCTMMRNEELSSAMITSNFVRNAACHLALPIPAYNDRLYLLMAALHRHVLQVPISYEPITFSADRYRVGFFINESLAGNFIILLLLLLGLVVLCVRGGPRMIVWYTGAWWLGFILFCVVFKWQVGASRLHLPLFMMTAPLLAYFVQNRFFCWLSIIPSMIFIGSFCYGQDDVCARAAIGMIGLLVTLLWWYRHRLTAANSIIILLFTASLPYLFCNSCKPILLNKRLITAYRRDNYLRYFWDESFEQSYVKAVDLLKAQGITRVALDNSMACPLHFLYPSLTVYYLRYKGYAGDYNNHPLLYDAVMTSSDETINLFDPSTVQRYSVMGPKTHHGIWMVIIFKQPMNRYIAG